MDVDIAAFVMTIRVCTNQDLMSWKMPLCEFHPELMSQFRSQLPILIVLRIEADDVVMRFDVREFLILAILCI